VAATPVEPTDPGAVPLAEWDPPEGISSTNEVMVDYGYGASYWIFSRIRDEIGIEALSRVIVAATSEAERAGDPVSSQRLLQMLEETGGSRQAAGLFTGYGAVSGEELPVAPSQDAVSGNGEEVTEEVADPVPVPTVVPAVAVAPLGERTMSPVVLLLILLPAIALFALVYRSRRGGGTVGGIAGGSPTLIAEAPTGYTLDGLPSYLVTPEKQDVGAGSDDFRESATPWVY